MKNIEMLKTIFKKTFEIDLCEEAILNLSCLCYGSYSDDTNYICGYDTKYMTDEGIGILYKLEEEAGRCENCYFNNWQDKEYAPIKHIIVEFEDEANKALFDKIKGKNGFCITYADIIENEKLFKLEKKPDAKIYFVYLFEKDGKLYADYATEGSGSFALVFEELEAKTIC